MGVQRLPSVWFSKLEISLIQAINRPRHAVSELIPQAAQASTEVVGAVTHQAAEVAKLGASELGSVGSAGLAALGWESDLDPGATWDMMNKEGKYIIKFNFECKYYVECLILSFFSVCNYSILIQSNLCFPAMSGSAPIQTSDLTRYRGCALRQQDQ